MAFALADRLGKSLGEIAQLSATEFAGWLAYFNIKATEQERAGLAAEAGRGARGRTTRMRGGRR